jgi:hypothetical protein
MFAPCPALIRRGCPPRVTVMTGVHCQCRSGCTNLPHNPSEQLALLLNEKPDWVDALDDIHADFGDQGVREIVRFVQERVLERLAGQRHVDERADRQPDGLGVDDADVALQDPRLLQRPHAPQARRR